MVSTMIFSTRENGEGNNSQDVKEYRDGFVSPKIKGNPLTQFSFDPTRFNHFTKFQFPSIWYFITSNFRDINNNSSVWTQLHSWFQSLCQSFAAKFHPSSFMLFGFKRFNTNEWSYKLFFSHNHRSNVSQSLIFCKRKKLEATFYFLPLFNTVLCSWQ